MVVECIFEIKGSMLANKQLLTTNIYSEQLKFFRKEYPKHMKKGNIKIMVHYGKMNKVIVTLDDALLEQKILDEYKNSKTFHALKMFKMAGLDYRILKDKREIKI